MTLPFDWTKLDQLMEQAGVDLVLASTRHNIRYLTGGYAFHFTERAQRLASGQYLAFAGIPRGRVDAAFYVGGVDERLGLEAQPLWIEQVRLGKLGDGAAAAAAAAECARRLIGAGATIGVEMPFLPAQAFLTLQRALPGATFIDVTDLLHELRAIKTNVEVARLRDVSERVAESIRAGFCAGRDGITTREVAAVIERDMAQRDLAFLWAFTNAGPGYLRAPSDTRWERGRLMHLDCGGERADYLADLCRMGGLGAPSELGGELVAACLAIQNGVRAQLRAGLRYGEVRELAQGVLGRSPYAGIGRIVAHGIGMVSHEQPMINDPAQAERTLAVGHVVSVETELLHPAEGQVKIEDTLAIIAGGVEGLGDLGRELLVVAA